MSTRKTAKDKCPECGQPFRVGPLPTAHERTRMQKTGIVDLGEPGESADCPRCRLKLRVVSVRMGTFFTRE